ncbi:UNVERIFIED_CONTAM: Transcription factor [Sesamum latifolium]|uniref:Transcription factor n=1 Tax=Sesamum latifolium TaxID=2727402 RepID=A0AAW2X4B5_9LAMI
MRRRRSRWRGSPLTFPQVSEILPWTLPPVHFSTRDHDPFFLPPPPPSSYGGLFNRRPSGLQYLGYEGGSSDHQLRLISESLGQVVHPISAPFGLQAELQKMTAQEIMDAKALAASKSHSEAERRRRERINNHLASSEAYSPAQQNGNFEERKKWGGKGDGSADIGSFDKIKRNHGAVEKLRWKILAGFATDKASLLAEVIQHVKELKRQTSQLAETSPVPTEIDELTVDNYASDEDGKWVLKASICCEDRPDLLPDLIKTLKALRLRTVKAEITTLGGRVRNVLFITGDEEYSNSCEQEQEQEQEQYSINSIQEALKAVMEKSNGDESGSSGSVKRQRTNTNVLNTEFLVKRTTDKKSGLWLKVIHQYCPTTTTTTTTITTGRHRDCQYRFLNLCCDVSGFQLCGVLYM